MQLVSNVVAMLQPITCRCYTFAWSGYVKAELYECQ